MNNYKCMVVIWNSICRCLGDIKYKANQYKEHGKSILIQKNCSAAEGEAFKAEKDADLYRKGLTQICQYFKKYFQFDCDQ